MVRLYLMPMIGAGVKGDPRRPKYSSALINAGVDWASMDYGNQPACLVAGDVPDDIHATLTANADCYAFPDGFQNGAAKVGSAANAVQNIAESFTIPATWIGANDTWLTVAHTLGAIFQLMQRLNGIIGSTNPFAGITLNTRMNQIPANIRQALIDAAASFGWDTSGITGTTTLRNAIKQLADDWGNTPLFIGPFSL